MNVFVFDDVSCSPRIRQKYKLETEEIQFLNQSLSQYGEETFFLVFCMKNASLDVCCSGLSPRSLLCSSVFKMKNKIYFAREISCFFYTS
jgi:hypothetical protein